MYGSGDYVPGAVCGVGSQHAAVKEQYKSLPHDVYCLVEETDKKQANVCTNNGIAESD